jgi:hypothetical protein
MVVLEQATSVLQSIARTFVSRYDGPVPEAPPLNTIIWMSLISLTALIVTGRILYLFFGNLKEIAIFTGFLLVLKGVQEAIVQAFDAGPWLHYNANKFIGGR